MNILLLSPPYEADSENAGVFPPLGLAYIAAVLKKAKHEVKIIDFCLGKIKKRKNGFCWYGKSYHEIEDEIRNYKPDLIGLGCFFSIRFPYVLKIAKICKKVFPNTPIVIGGIHATVNPKLVLKNKEIDYIVLGEGENTIIDLINAIKGENTFESIGGLAFRKNGKNYVNPKNKFIEDLDKLPLPARDLLDMEAYIADRTIRWNLNSRRHASVFTSRGCPNRCTFCSMFYINGRCFRSRNPIKVADEIETLVKNYEIEEISFEDDNLTFDKERMIKICQEVIKRKLKIYWNTPNGISAKTLDEEVLTWMRKAGCVSVNVAIESGDPYILNQVIRKGLSLKKAEEVVKIADKVGLLVNSYFVLGMPGETRESVERTMKYACSLPLYDIGISFATPFKGTELYDDCIKNKYVPKNIEEIMLKNGFRIYGTPIIETPFLSKKELLKFKRKFYIYFHLTKMLKRPLAFLRYLLENKHLFVPAFNYFKVAFKKDGKY